MQQQGPLGSAQTMLTADPPAHTRLRGLVVIAHGSSSRVAIANAIRLAARGVEHDVVARLEERLTALDRRPDRETADAG